MNEDLVINMLATEDWVENYDNTTANERVRAVRETIESVKAAMVISGADKRRYGQLKLNLANDCILGTDQYPDNLEKAVNLLTNY